MSGRRPCAPHLRRVSQVLKSRFRSGTQGAVLSPSPGRSVPIHGLEQQYQHKTSSFSPLCTSCARLRAHELLNLSTVLWIFFFDVKVLWIWMGEKEKAKPKLICEEQDLTSGL